MTKRKAGSGPGSERPCPWCSSPVAEGAERCPSCGAVLREAAAPDGDDIPGVTQVDPVLRQRRPLARPNRLVGWLADVDTEPSPAIDLGRGLGDGSGGIQGLEAAERASFAPPSDEVRREMARLELEAIRLELEARAAEARLAELDAGSAGDGDGPSG